MAVDIEWDSEEQIPEAFKSFVDTGDIVHEDGKYRLVAKGYVPKKKLDEFRDTNIKHKQDLEKLQREYQAVLEQQPKLQAELETLKGRVAAGADDEKIQEALAQQLVEMELESGQRVKLHRESKPALEARWKALQKRQADADARLQDVTRELATERIDGGARAAMSAIGGFQEQAHDDVTRYVQSKFRMGGDHKPYLPDLDAAPDKDGVYPPTVGEDGKPVTIEQHLRKIVESGTKNGVWIREANGPTRIPRAGGTPPGKKVVGSDRIAKGLAKTA